MDNIAEVRPTFNIIDVDAVDIIDVDALDVITGENGRNIIRENADSVDAFSVPFAFEDRITIGIEFSPFHSLGFKG